MESVLGQTFDDLELIVVDDASTDYTADLVEGYRDRRLRLLVHEVNRNGAAARNTGIEKSHGEYIAFLDSDDEWLPRKLELQIGHLENLPPAWAFSYTGFHRVDATGSSHACIPKYEGDLYTRLFSQHLPGFGSTGLVRRDCFEKTGVFDERLPRHQDWDMAVRLAKYYKVACLSTPLARIYKGPRPAAVKVELAKKVFLSKLDAELRSLPALQRHSILGLHHRELARRFCLEGKLIKGSRYWCSAISHKPTLLVPPPMAYKVKDLVRRLWKRFRDRRQGA